MANPHYLSPEFADDYYSVINGDVFYPVNVWPRGMFHKFRCSNLGYSHRVYITTYAYLNGLDPVLLINSLRYINSFATQHKVRKIIDIYNWFADPFYGFNRRSRYYSYCHYHNVVHDLNCNPIVPRNGSQPPRGGYVPGNDGRPGLYHC